MRERQGDLCELDTKQVLGQPKLYRETLCQKQNKKTKCAVGTKLTFDSFFFSGLEVKVSDGAFCTQEALGSTPSTKKKVKIQTCVVLCGLGSAAVLAPTRRSAKTHRERIRCVSEGQVPAW